MVHAFDLFISRRNHHFWKKSTIGNKQGKDRYRKDKQNSQIFELVIRYAELVCAVKLTFKRPSKTWMFSEMRFRLLITRFLRYKVVIWLNLFMEFLNFFTRTFQKMLTRVNGGGTVSRRIKIKRPSVFLCPRSSTDHLQTEHDNLLCNVELENWFE